VDSGHVETLPSAVIAGLVPAISIVMVLCLNNRGRRDKPGDDEYGGQRHENEITDGGNIEDKKYRN
jgi:hypothetical protein